MTTLLELSSHVYSGSYEYTHEFGKNSLFCMHACATSLVYNGYGGPGMQ